MSADKDPKEKRTTDPFLNRRSGEDRRRVYDLDYFEQGGAERRKAHERGEKCQKASDWSSVCPPEKPPEP